MRILRYLNNTSIALHSLGVTALIIAVLAKAPTHQPGSFVFGTFYDGTGTAPSPGWSERASPAYLAVCGALLTQYTLTGFDASAHLSEETRKAEWSAPLGVVTSVGVSAVFGFFVLLGLLFSIQDFAGTVGSAYGQPVLQILVDVFGPDGAVVLMCLIMVCVWHCGLFSMTSNSRMMFAFSRDRALPPFFHAVDARFQSPVRTVWLAATLAFLLALPSLGSSVAFAAATSIATIGLYVSYMIPILIAALYPANFRKGPFDLRWASRPVAFVGALWVGFITVVFCLPTANPVTSQTVNYTVAAVGILSLWVAASWLLWARRWFTGPIRQIEAEGRGVNVMEPEALAELDMKS